jgi:tRNA(fMet)-specific endonuclease VapC
MYLLDTNICIYFMKNSYPHLTERLLSHSPSELLISSITVLELGYGAEKSNWGYRTRQKMAMFLAPFTIIPFDVNDALAAAGIRAHLEGLGVIIGAYNIQIAAQGLARGLTVVTHNTKEFNRIPDLKLEDWVL